MSRDPIDDFGERLFDALRDEAPPQGAQQRLIDAARRTSSERPRAMRSWRLPALALPALAAAAAAVLVFTNRERPLAGISAEPPSAVRPARLAPPTVKPDTSAAVIPPAPRASASAARRAAPQVVPSARAVTLADELDALQRARQALAQGDTAAALEALDHYDRVLKGRELRAEASLLRMDALSRAGRKEAAAELARRFVEQNPGSPLVDRARTFMTPPGSSTAD